MDAPYAVVTGDTAATTIQYAEQDALGNVLGTHTGTTPTETLSYDAWGYPTTSGALTNRLMWKGLLWEGDLVGLYYMRGRWYDPAVGRFIQEDPLGVDGGINLYAFSGDDPVNGSDPSGRGPLCSTTPEVFNGWQYIPGVEVCDPQIATGDDPIAGFRAPTPTDLGDVPPGDPPGSLPSIRGNNNNRDAKPKTDRHIDKLACATSLAGLGLTFAGDAAFFTGIGAGARFLIVGAREARLGATFAEGAVQGIAHFQTAAGMRTAASASIAVAAFNQWGPDGIQNALITGASHWRDFVPGFDLWEAAKSVRESCSTH